MINIGKRCGTKLLTQEEINSLLIAYASECEVVVRLKGGDPTIFGRAGEEIEALLEANISVRDRSRRDLRDSRCRRRRALAD